jgi:hypothetical protein
MKTLLVVALLIHVTICSGLCQVIVVSPNTTGKYYNYNDITTGRSGQVYVESNSRRSWDTDYPSKFVYDLGSGKGYFEFDYDSGTFTAPIQDDEDEDD